MRTSKTLAATAATMAGFLVLLTSFSVEGKAKPEPLDPADVAGLSAAANDVGGAVGDAATQAAGDALGDALRGLSEDVYLLGEVPGVTDHAYKVVRKIRGRKVPVIVVQREGGLVDALVVGDGLALSDMMGKGGSAALKAALKPAGIGGAIGLLFTRPPKGSYDAKGGPMGALMGGLGSILGKSRGRFLAGLLDDDSGTSGGRAELVIAEEVGNPCYGMASWTRPGHRATLRWFVSETSGRGSAVFQLVVEKGGAPHVGIMAVRVANPEG